MLRDVKYIVRKSRNSRGKFRNVENVRGGSGSLKDFEGCQIFVRKFGYSKHCSAKCNDSTDAQRTKEIYLIPKYIQERKRILRDGQR